MLYLAEHLLVNSQAALWAGQEGSYFIRMVNSLESLPYLPAIEIILIGIPLAIHAVWGIHRIFTAKSNVHDAKGAKPALPYARNRAFTWQRASSWILLFGLLGHVAQMRFLHAPREMSGHYEVRIREDASLPPLAARLGVALRPLDSGVVEAVADTPGKAMLLMVRDTFKSPWMAAGYTLFLLAAAFHACNGFWTFLITWGALLSYRSQKAMIPVSVVAMGLFTFLGCAAIWGSYWLASS